MDIFSNKGSANENIDIPTLLPIPIYSPSPISIPSPPASFPPLPVTGPTGMQRGFRGVMEHLERGAQVRLQPAGRPVRADFGMRRQSVRALWARIIKNPDESTGPLARPFARSLAPLTRSLAPDCSLCSRPPLRSLVCSLCSYRSLPRSWDSE